MGLENIASEFHYRTSRSSGAGGQSVNKTETRVEVVFDVHTSMVLSQAQKDLLVDRLGTQLSMAGTISISVSEHRGQLENKRQATKEMIDLVSAGLEVKKKRRPTRPTKASKLKRIEAKVKRSEIKKHRRWRID